MISGLLPDEKVSHGRIVPVQQDEMHAGANRPRDGLRLQRLLIQSVSLEERINPLRGGRIERRQATPYRDALQSVVLPRW